MVNKEKTLLILLGVTIITLVIYIIISSINLKKSKKEFLDLDKEYITFKSNLDSIKQEEVINNFKTNELKKEIKVLKDSLQVIEVELKSLEGTISKLLQERKNLKRKNKELYENSVIRIISDSTFLDSLRRANFNR